MSQSGSDTIFSIRTLASASPEGLTEIAQRILQHTLNTPMPTQEQREAVEALMEHLQYAIHMVYQGHRKLADQHGNIQMRLYDGGEDMYMSIGTTGAIGFNLHAIAEALREGVMPCELSIGHSNSISRHPDTSPDNTNVPLSMWLEHSMAKHLFVSANLQKEEYWPITQQMDKRRIFGSRIPPINDDRLLAALRNRLYQISTEQANSTLE